MLYLDRVRTERAAACSMHHITDLHDGAAERVRPKIMTVASTMIGLLPILWGTGTGASVMKCVAVSMVGGMLTSTVLTLVEIPAVYSRWRQRALVAADPGKPIAAPPILVLAQRPA